MLTKNALLTLPKHLTASVCLAFMLTACGGGGETGNTGNTNENKDIPVSTYVMTDIHFGNSLVASAYGGRPIQERQNILESYETYPGFHHEAYNDRKQGQWRWEYVLTGEDGHDYYHIRDRSENLAIVAKTINLIRYSLLGEQEIVGQKDVIAHTVADFHDEGALWRKEVVDYPEPISAFYIINKKYEQALVADDTANGDIFFPVIPYIVLGDVAAGSYNPGAWWRFDEVDFGDKQAEYSGMSFRLTDVKHNLAMVAGDVGDNNVYHQSPNRRTNAEWQIKPQPSTANCPGEFGTWNHITDRKHGYALVAGDVNDNNVYHQTIAGRDNELWKLEPLDDGSYHVIDCKHGEALVAGDNADNNTYHQLPNGRLNAQWNITEIVPLDSMNQEEHIALGYTKTDEELETLLDAYSPQWRFYGDEYLFPVDVESHLTTDINPLSPDKTRVCRDDKWRLSYAPTAFLGGSYSNAKTVGIVEQIAGGYNLTYYLYYPYNVANDFINSHDHYGDWERATITFLWEESDNIKYLKPYSLTTEAHGNKWKVLWDVGEVWLDLGSPSINEVGETIYPPMVFVAENSHGTYPNTKHERAIFDAPSEDSTNRTCVDAWSHWFCDYIERSSYAIRYPTLALRAISNTNGLEKIVYLGTDQTPPWLNQNYQCSTEDVSPAPAMGPIYRWGSDVVCDWYGCSNEGPTGPFDKKIWGWYDKS